MEYYSDRNLEKIQVERQLRSKKNEEILYGLSDSFRKGT